MGEMRGVKHGGNEGLEITSGGGNEGGKMDKNSQGKIQDREEPSMVASMHIGHMDLII
jgi:hypothetical protein